MARDAWRIRLAASRPSGTGIWAPDSLLELADHLADAVRAAGTDVSFRGAGHHVLSPAVTADALRIIQEGLTNSMKHAPGAPVSVTLEVTATGLNIDIINEPARSAPLELDGGAGGAGLPGMTERVKAHGGQLSAGPVPGGGWRVAASLPSGTHPDYSVPRTTAAQAVEHEGPADSPE